jgi:antibiotic biosynthesis monooxygenase (ABM) superfamily enzyme
MNVSNLTHLPQLLRPATAEPLRDEPITVTVARTVLPDNRKAFEDWAEGIQSRMSDYPGHLGSTMLSPGPGEDEYHSVYRFADADTLQDWEHSEDRAQWLAKLEEMVESERFAHVTGLETWFTLPDRADQGPPRWKMVAVTSTVIFALQLPIQAFLLSTLLNWPLVLRAAIMSLAMTLLMTYVLMPRVTRLLRRWLYPHTEQATITTDADEHADGVTEPRGVVRFWEQVGQAQVVRSAAHDRELAGLEVLAPSAR